MFHSVEGIIECCICSLATKCPTIFTPGCECGKEKGCSKCQMHKSKHFKTRRGALRHLQAHIDAGHEVPEYALESLLRELKEVGNKVKA